MIVANVQIWEILYNICDGIILCMHIEWFIFKCWYYLYLIHFIINLFLCIYSSASIISNKSIYCILFYCYLYPSMIFWMNEWMETIFFFNLTDIITIWPHFATYFNVYVVISNIPKYFFIYFNIIYKLIFDGQLLIDILWVFVMEIKIKKLVITINNICNEFPPSILWEIYGVVSRIYKKTDKILWQWP